MNLEALTWNCFDYFFTSPRLNLERKQSKLADPPQRLKAIIVRCSASEDKLQEHEAVKISLEKLGENKNRAARQTVATVLQVDQARLMDVDSISRKSARLLPQAILEALDERIRTRQWESALKVFGLLRVQEWYEPKEETYVKLLMLLGKCKLPDVASELFEVMLTKDRLVPSLKAFTALLYAYVHNGSSHIDSAFALFEHMKTLPEYDPDVHVFTILIKGCCEHGLFDRASLLLMEMWDSGVTPNVVTYNTLIHTFGKVGMLSQMEDVFFHMLKTGTCKPDIWTWNIIIKHYGSRGRIEKMEQWFELLQEARVPPDNITFNTLVTAYGRNELFAKMKSVLIYMRNYLYTPDEVTFNSMIEAYGKAGMIEEMGNTFNAMKRAGVKFSALTLCCLLNAYAKKGIWTAVEKVRRQWRNSDLVPDVALYNSLIFAYGKAGNADEMQSSFLEMKNAGLVPDEITYTILIKAFKNMKMEDRAHDLLRQMKSLQAG